MRIAARLLQRLEYALAGLMLFSGLVLVCIQILGRVVPQVGFLGSEELSRYLLIWVTYLGASAATQEGSHIRAEMLLTLLAPRARRVVEVGVTLICLAFSLSLVYAGVLLVRDSLAFNLMSAASNLPVPIWAFQLIVPLGFALISVRLFLQLMNLLWRKKLPESAAVDVSAADEGGF